MRVIETIAEMKEARQQLARMVGFVPTMGALHAGHLSLIRIASGDCPHVVVSIFVNPAQFNEKRDFDAYPRDLQRDLRALSAEGVDTVFTPSSEEIFPPGFEDWIEVKGPLTERLEGEFRPGHFRGVTTALTRLFNTVQPDRAYFGEKDAQQLRVVQRLVKEQKMPMKVIGLPTVREPDGLAMSSRNAHLSPEEREAALAIPSALETASRMVSGGIKEAEAVRETIRRVLEMESPVSVEYVSVSDPDTFEELEIIDRPALALIAVHVGSTRLIDNQPLAPGERRPRPLSFGT